MTEYQFCPRCATPLIERADAEHEGGRIRQTCPDTECGYVHWNNPLPVVAAIVEYEGKILLARNAAWPEGMFALITGFLENGETPEEGIAREVLEETSLHAETVELIGVYDCAVAGIARIPAGRTGQIASVACGHRSGARRMDAAARLAVRVRRKAGAVSRSMRWPMTLCSGTSAAWLISSI
jgi:ADP-ribose pyrophosphatase YjhB (NUDIX family)